MTHEKALLKLALLYKKRYTDCNPEVGMGPSLNTLYTELVNEANELVIGVLTVSDKQRADVIAFVENDGK